MTDPSFKPGEFQVYMDEPTAIETERDREIESLRNEVMWLRSTHRHMIDQLAARAAMPPVYQITEPAPGVLTDQKRSAVPHYGPPLRPDQPIPNTELASIKADRLTQLLAIERAAKRVASPIVRSQYGAQGNVLVPMPLITEMVAAINAINAKDQPCPSTST